MRMNAAPLRGWAAAGLALLGWLCVQASGSSQPSAPVRPGEAPGWEADWIERDFPFFSSVVDARTAGSPFPADNLTPRSLVLNLGRGHWVAFDTDLLRVAAAWRGQGVTPVALAPGSYHNAGRKTPGGQVPAPEPVGTVWVANGIYPGWQIGARPSFEDPREPAPSPEEVGRGPLAEPMGRFRAIRHVPGGAVLEYTIGRTPIRERFAVSDADRPRTIERHIEVGPTTDTLWLVLGIPSRDVSVGLDDGAAPSAVLETMAMAAGPSVRDTESRRGEPADPRPVKAVRVAPHEQAVRFSVVFSDGVAPPAVTRRAIPSEAPAVRWPQEVRTRVSLSKKPEAYVVDDVELPRQNPWRRLVRVSDVQFLPDGTAVVVTLDGDVWLARGLHERGGQIRWRRFASGLHEPLTLAIRDAEIYVFDRNGIWRLRDANADGEADVHELFSNAFAQTADMREFPNTIRLAPGGTFVIAKGGQEATTIGKHNGSVLRISADGREATVLGYGLRQPNLGVNLRTGLITASDQQGHYVPSTPLHIIRDRQFYGFISTTLPPETYPATPIADPLTWIPHAVNASAMSQVWLFDARLGPLDNSLVHIGFNRPELFRVLFNTRSRTPQAAVVSITHDFDFPPLNGAVNPADGLLYLAGFQILGWGTTATRLAGMGRVRYTGAASTLPREIVPMDKGVLLRFDSELDAARAVDPSNYTVATWHYQRTHKYGSPQLKADGTAGHRPPDTQPRARLGRPPRRVRGRARHGPRDADAGGVVAHDVGRRPVQRECLVHAVRAGAVRSTCRGLRRHLDRADAHDEDGSTQEGSGQRDRRTVVVRARRLHGVSRERAVDHGKARPVAGRALWHATDVCRRQRASQGRRRVPARGHPRTRGEDRRGLRAEWRRHAELRGRAHGCAGRVDDSVHQEPEVASIGSMDRRWPHTGSDPIALAHPVRGSLSSRSCQILSVALVRGSRPILSDRVRGSCPWLTADGSCSP